ncbi:predicted protein [Enterococcus casseliflavus EC30]|jgi:hypothetical protein|nr:predicted protein [Enterococcus casseliflavus EC30]EEV35440.1 predicted protein [Enterococcus casseliflavus EC10]
MGGRRMKRTEYVTLQDQTLIDLFQQLGEDVSNLELIDEEKNIDVVVVSNSDWQYLLEQVNDDVKESFADTSETDLDEELADE